jgi:iron-regulated transporter 1
MTIADLNASMRRIDLFCKLVAPVFISLVDSFSTRVAIWTVLGLSTASVLVEYVAIAQVYRAVPNLKRTSTAILQTDAWDEIATQTQHHSPQNLMSRLRDTLAPWQEFATSRVFMASFALSLLYLTVLSFGATMVTYLLHSGFSPLEVSYMRIGSVAAELSGTWIAPIVMNRIGPIRSGLWFLNWQFCCVAGAAVAYVPWDSNSRLVAGCLVIGVALSRIGLWGFDLSVQFLVQEVSSNGVYIRGSCYLCWLENYRMSKSMPERGSRPLRWHCRTFLRCCLSRLLLCSLVRSSLNTR